MRKVTLQMSGATGPPTVILDETAVPSYAGQTDGWVNGFQPMAASQMQITKLFRGRFPFLAYRFNLQTTLELVVIHRFSTHEQAQDFVGNRPYIIRCGELAIYSQFSDGTYTRYYKTAFLPEVRPTADKGLRQEFTYKFLINSQYSTTP